MKSKQAFTLIELLVVVLIIGILAAVALPQYQKAVWKSRNAQLKTLIKSIVQAQASYFMATGGYTVNFSELSLDLPLSVPTFTSTLEPICKLNVQGSSDAVRQGKDFQVALTRNNSADAAWVAAVWTDGQYKCTGFSISLATQEMQCIESYYGDFAAKTPGRFCEKIERGTNKQDFALWYWWDLP